jgi:hypothetical protein
MPQVFDNETIRSFLRGAFRRLGYHVPAMDIGPDAMIARAGRSLHSTCMEQFHCLDLHARSSQESMLVLTALLSNQSQVGCERTKNMHREYQGGNPCAGAVPRSLPKATQRQCFYRG